MGFPVLSEGAKTTINGRLHVKIPQSLAVKGEEELLQMVREAFFLISPRNATRITSQKAAHFYRNDGRLCKEGYLLAIERLFGARSWQSWQVHTGGYPGHLKLKKEQGRIEISFSDLTEAEISGLHWAMALYLEWGRVTTERQD